MSLKKQEQDGVAGGNIIRLERSSIHDGQGLRTVVFLKGCPLNCPWCSTPESQNFLFEKGYDQLQCTTCFRCTEACSKGAITVLEDGSGVHTDQAKCQACFACYEVCPARAIKKYGYKISIESLMKEISKDEIFYFHSGGGVTLSGGEPLCQPDFCAKLLQECQSRGINTAIESSLYVNYSNIEASLPWLDHLYCDLKHMDEHVHTTTIGKSNALVLTNLLRIDQSDYHLPITVRIPLIPGFNNSPQNLEETLDFCCQLKNLYEIELLPYHRLGTDTYRLLGRDYACKHLLTPTTTDLKSLKSYMDSLGAGIPVKVGSGLA